MEDETLEEFIQKNIRKFEDLSPVNFNIESIGINSTNWLEIFDDRYMVDLNARTR